VSYLKELFDKYNCDKSAKHNYHEVYESLFEPYQNDPINFLEIGVFKGASTAAIHEYFPNATIYGLDIFERVDVNEIDILKEDRVNWLKGNSLNPSIADAIEAKWPGIKFDFILDDGAHWPEANRKTMENIIQFLAEDGIYIIEDVFPMSIMTQSELNLPWLKQSPDKYDMLKYYEFEDAMKKTGLAINRYDLRGSNAPDSYVVTLS